MTTKTKARPILFSAPMIRALLAGTKTQTRRAIKRALKHPGWTQYVYFGPSANNPACESRAIECGPDYPDADDDVVPCPYGAAGDLLWVRETWLEDGERVHYRADTADMEGAAKMLGGWLPSIFMPRRHSRITLRITEVRVQRLMDISEADAIAEGIEREGQGWKSYEIIHQGRHKGERHPHAVVPNGSPMVSYRELWESINGADSWATTVWVWAISFEVIHNNVTEIQTNE